MKSIYFQLTPIILLIAAQTASADLIVINQTETPIHCILYSNELKKAVRSYSLGAKIKEFEPKFTLKTEALRPNTVIYCGYRKVCGDLHSSLSIYQEECLAYRITDAYRIIRYTGEAAAENTIGWEKQMPYQTEMQTIEHEDKSE